MCCGSPGKLMRILFVHQNFPGQYKHLAPALAARGHEVHALCINKQAVPAGVTVHRYRVAGWNAKDIHPWVIDLETKVLRGEACARAAHKLLDDGFYPEVICVHPGWGEGLFLREIWPQAKQLHYVEYFYSSAGGDVGFDPEFGLPDLKIRSRVRMKNANSLLNLNTMDQGVSPTWWQRSTVPDVYQDAISVIHDGIDTDIVKPDPEAVFSFKDTDGRLRQFRHGEQILTFVNRNLEPSRGYHIFMRALPELLWRHPKLQVLIVGGDEVSYGARPESGSYKMRYFTEVEERIDPSRIHFLGRIPYTDYLKLLQVSRVHAYLTYPFVLSWSLLEAMSAGCLVVASKTPPVEEVLNHGENGLLFDFFSPMDLAEKVSNALSTNEKILSLKQKARLTVLDRYDLKNCLPKLLNLVETMI